MADFHPILARAIAGLTDKSPEARRAVYDRALADTSTRSPRGKEVRPWITTL